MSFAFAAVALAFALGYFWWRARHADAPRPAPRASTARGEAATRRVAARPAMGTTGTAAARPLPALPPLLAFKAGAQACDAAQRRDGSRCRRAEAPMVPLRACSRGDCACRWEPVADQRSGDERRRTPDRREAIRFESDKPDRRSGRDRRADHATWTSRGPT